MSIAIAYTPIDGEQCYIETFGNLANVLQLAKELLLMSDRIENLFHLKTVTQLVRIVVRQELRIPVVQVTGMEDTPPFGLNYPRNTTVCAT